MTELHATVDERAAAAPCAAEFDGYVGAQEMRGELRGKGVKCLCRNGNGHDHLDPFAHDDTPQA